MRDPAAQSVMEDAVTLQTSTLILSKHYLKLLLFIPTFPKTLVPVVDPS